MARYQTDQCSFQIPRTSLSSSGSDPVPAASPASPLVNADADVVVPLGVEVGERLNELADADAESSVCAWLLCSALARRKRDMPKPMATLPATNSAGLSR